MLLIVESYRYDLVSPRKAVLVVLVVSSIPQAFHVLQPQQMQEKDVLELVKVGESNAGALLHCAVLCCAHAYFRFQILPLDAVCVCACSTFFVVFHGHPSVRDLYYYCLLRQNNHHVCQKGGLPRSLSSDEPNPFVRYRPFLFSYRVAIARGMSDEEYVALIDRCAAAIAKIDSGRALRQTPLTWDSAMVSE